MKLPNAHLALAEQSKIIEYLLNPAHPDNGGKALFFQSLGFRPEEWQVLADAFRKLAQTGEVSKSMESPHGCKYILDGYIETPSGRTSMVRMIWIVDRGANTPRLVTAYPHSE
jgi:Domain of unknown function (DUF6883)